MQIASSRMEQSRFVPGIMLARASGLHPPSLSDLMELMGAADWDRQWTDDVQLELHRVQVGTALFHEGAKAKYTYVVRCGTFKSIRTAEDGYEQVLAFTGPGEVLGFDAVHLGQHPVSAVALESATAYALPIRGLSDLRRHVPAFDEILLTALSRQMSHASDIAEVMAAVAAEVRLARFIVQMSTRLAERGQSPYRMHLRMCRRDIASHLGVAHETVSRSFSALAQCGLVRIDNRELEIMNLEGLRELSRSTRGLVS